MKNSEDDFVVGLLTGLFLAVGIAYLLEEQRKQQYRLNQLQQNLNRGFELDQQNLLSDWNNVYSDVKKGYELEKQNYETSAK